MYASFAASNTVDLQHYGCETVNTVTGACGVQTSPLGFLECLKYDTVDFCLNSQPIPRLITEMNNSKTPCIQQVSSDA